MGLPCNLLDTLWHVSISNSPRKTCHLPVDIEHKAYYAIKIVNLDLKSIGPLRNFKLNELEELRYDEYENMYIFKKNMKLWHDRHISRRIFYPSNKVLL